MERPYRLALVVAAVLLLAPPQPTQADEREDFFESKIRPILVGTCLPCHGETKTSGALRIDSRENLLVGGDSGPALVPGEPETSLLVRAIQRHEDVSAMPPDEEKALRPDQVADFVTWIQAGAVWPQGAARLASEQHWAFQPIRDPVIPDVEDTAWLKTSVDSFIRARQEAAGVQPAPRADKRTLIRRATFDLTGLPPTPAEIEAFLHDSSPEAFLSVVDRLLDSPAYGERWGRHWLDVVRYADTAGETADYPVPVAWRYRNYVIDALNADKPYDQFLREQIAGDILARQGPHELYAERVTATGYLALSRRFGFDSENYHHLTIQDTIDTLGQSVLGLSLGCARCHDHKFDAISMQDYYALYGIFDSSRYAFPGSEQKQKFRCLAPLVPPQQAEREWLTYRARIEELTDALARHQQPVPAVVLRSLHDLDGDFELQAPAAGGSNGVLVPPWRYEGKIAVTNAAQSPFKNLYGSGKVGASIPADAGKYRIEQALYPSRSGEGGNPLFVNLDFRVAAPEGGVAGQHRFSLGAIAAAPLVEVLIAHEEIVIRTGGPDERRFELEPAQWQNLQLTIDLQQRAIAGRVGAPGATAEFSDLAIASDRPALIEHVVIDAAQADVPGTAIEFDNLGVQESRIPPVSLENPQLDSARGDADATKYAEQLKTLTGIDGDFELQAADAPPAQPWGPGPNSVVTLSAAAQSPFANLFPPGALGVHMPNRGEYDGFGQTLPNIAPDEEGRLFVSFDFRCANADAGGDGSWRYYLGHGPGNSAAVELFFNGKEFFRRSGDARDAVSSLVVGEWYQVRLAVELAAKRYTGELASRTGTTTFAGQLASGWDGIIDYTFIDSYGHIGGVRPALDADNFVVTKEALPPLDAPPRQAEPDGRAARRAQVERIRQQLRELEVTAQRQREELQTLLAAGPFAMAYGMAEGTPQNARIHMRGEPDQPGDEAPRGFLQVLGGGPLPAEAQGSGRLELAQWLTRPNHPLTARVMANRIWQYHFGRGLVKTPNDFGVRGLPPTHPDLLDHLATQFIHSGWSQKALHRLIMGSATYQQASDAPHVELPAGADPGDLYIAFTRRRLSAEEIRDAILAVSGELDQHVAAGHPFPSPIDWSFTQHGPFQAVYDHNQRSIYLMTQRLKRHPFLALFDGADPNTTTAARLPTTVPTQALFFMNDPFVHAKAEAWAARLITTEADETRQIERAWLVALGRRPTADEQREVAEFLGAYRTELEALGKQQVQHRALAACLRALIGSNEFLHVD